jgi:uncharacterized protein (DUF934 family)
MHFIDPHAALPEGTLLLANTDDVLARAEQIRAHPCVALDFPRWTDGRAYSQAVLLRGRLRWAGEIVATGDVMADMLPLLRRCGFTAVRLRADQELRTAQRALGFFDGDVRPYQASHAERARPAARDAA